MTLILMMQAPGWVALTSDRMLSTPDGAGTQNHAIKLVLYFNDMVFAYTGPSQLIAENKQWQSTDLWLAELLESLPERSIPAALEKIQQQTQAAFDRRFALIPKSKVIPFAIAGVGWERDSSDPPGIHCSVDALISNFHEEQDGLSIPGQATKTFTLSINRLRDYHNHIGLGSMGCAQSPNESRWLREQMFATYNTTHAAEKFVDLMKDSIRQTSTRLRGKYVGKDILAAVIFRKAAISNRVVACIPQAKSGIVFDNDTVMKPVQSQAEPDYSLFLRFRGGRDTGLYATPHIVAPGFKHARGWVNETGEYMLSSRVKGGRNGTASVFFGTTIQSTTQKRKRK
jgi:hypothetical protein